MVGFTLRISLVRCVNVWKTTPETPIPLKSIARPEKTAKSMVTKRDLTSWGNILFMALIGLIIASLVNMFLRSPAMYWILTYVGVLIFVGEIIALYLVRSTALPF